MKLLAEKDVEDPSLSEARKWILRGHQIYLEQAEMPEKLEDLDFYLYIKSRMIAYMKYPPGESARQDPIFKVYANSRQGNINPSGGNELSYDEAFLFLDYLIGKYGLSSGLKYCLNEHASFQDTFGLSYDEAKENWLAYVQ